MDKFITRSDHLKWTLYKRIGYLQSKEGITSQKVSKALEETANNLKWGNLSLGDEGRMALLKYTSALFTELDQPVPTVREVLKHIKKHGAKTCFFCGKTVPSEMPNHVKTCWFSWKLRKEKVLQ